MILFVCLVGRIIPARAGFTGTTFETYSYTPWIIPARAGFTVHALRDGGGALDHPRSRGVYLGQCQSPSPPPGSSPLARGLLKLEDGVWDAPRIIPARAGFTTEHRKETQWLTDHPRSRGVYTPVSFSSGLVWGSSPLARGLHMFHLLTVNAVVDHPRSRGVYSIADVMPSNSKGSSPLARGLLGSGGNKTV